MPAARTRSLSRGVERAALAEHVDPAAVRRAGAEHLAADEVDVFVAPVGVLRRDDVRPEERDLARDLGGEPREARLVVHGEPVAGLHLERRRALRPQLGDEAGKAGTQLVVRRRAGRRDGPPYAARGIRRARHARLELVGPVAAEDEVGVAVDEPRDDGPPAGIHHLDLARGHAFSRDSILAPRLRPRGAVSAHGCCLADGGDRRPPPRSRRGGAAHPPRRRPTRSANPRSAPRVAERAARIAIGGDVGRQLADVRDQRASVTASGSSGRARARPPWRGRSRRRRAA